MCQSCMGPLIGWPPGQQTPWQDSEVPSLYPLESQDVKLGRFMETSSPVPQQGLFLPLSIVFPAGQGLELRSGHKASEKRPQFCLQVLIMGYQKRPEYSTRWCFGFSFTVDYLCEEDKSHFCLFLQLQYEDTISNPTE